MRRRPIRRRGQRAQSLVELSLVVPVCLSLFMGVYTAGSFISDMDIAGQSVRAGARLGAELGDDNYTSTSTASGCQTAANDPCIVDDAILTSTLTVARDLKNIASVDEVDVYDPCASGGSCTTATSACSYSSGSFNGSYNSVDPHDDYVYDGSGNYDESNFALSGSAGYTLDKRDQSHPNETVVAVRLKFTFKAAAPFNFFNIQTSQYATMCFAPIESGG